MARVTTTKVSESIGSSTWLLKFPSTPFKQGASYYVTAYTGRADLLLETAVRRKPVSPSVYRRIEPIARKALTP